MSERVPPQDVEAEMAVLGGMLLSARAIGEVGEILAGKDFYKPAHELIFTAILDLYAEGEGADAVTVGALLAKRGEIARVGGVPYLHTLMGSVPTAANAGYHAEIVHEHAVRRRIIEAGTRIAAMGWETDDGADLADIIDRAQAETHALSCVDQQAASTPADSVIRVLEGIETPGGRGLATGFRDLDELTDGLQPGQMVIVAARPAIGKSTFALDVCRHVAIDLGLHAAFFSLEMRQDEITKRCLSAEAAVALHHLRHGRMTEDDWLRLSKQMPRVSAAPLHVDDTPGLSMMAIRTKARRLKQQYDLRLIVVDYLQLMSSGAARRHENRQTEVSEISRGIKLLGQELDVPVIAVAQLNRGPEARSDKRPMMSDLRESGALEMDADIVILLHREDAYERESPRAGEADLIVAKHRNGATSTITVAFQGHYSRFVDMAQS